MHAPLKTRSQDVAKEAYGRLQKKSPDLFVTPWDHLPEHMQLAFAYMVVAGSEAVCESIFNQLHERMDEGERLQ